MRAIQSFWSHRVITSHFLATSLCVMLGSSSVLGVFFAGGTGDPNDPYQIATAQQLLSIGSNPTLLNKCFVLTADLDLDPNLPGGQVFNRAVIAPDVNATLGFQGTAFTGTLDGGGSSIRNLTIRGGSYLGLFGTLGAGAQIVNLRLIEVDIALSDSGQETGALAGMSSGRITNCHASGRVRGDLDAGGLVGANAAAGVIIDCGAEGTCNQDGFSHGSTGGGLVGSNQGTVIRSYARSQVTGAFSTGGLIGYNDGSVSGCYARGEVTGNFYLGGLVGSNAGSICDSYSIGPVYGRDMTPYVGGLVGSNLGAIVRAYAVGTVRHPTRSVPYFSALIGGVPGSPFSGRVTDCFWDVSCNGVRVNEGGGSGLTTAQMMDVQVYSLNGWGNDPNWVLDPGRDYPRLAWEGTAGASIPVPVVDGFEGSGTPDDPYVITTPEQLARIGTASVLWDKAFLLTADVNLAGVAFPSIGICPGSEFTGCFDGGRHAISSLALDVRDIVDASRVGLFGYIGRTGVIRSVTVCDSVIQGGWATSNAGILAGINHGSVTSCSVIDANISAGSYSQNLGGLVGYNAGTISGCSATGIISGGKGGDAFGGLVGRSGAGSIVRSYANVDIHGVTTVGGLVGELEGAVADCYATGAATGGLYVGGLVGASLDHGSITNSYAAVSVSCTDKHALGGLVAYHEGRTADATITGCFWDVEASGVSEDKHGTGLTATQMQDAESFIDAGWDFVGERANGTAETWFVPEGGRRPALTILSPSGAGHSLAGTGTAADPYLIATTEDLAAMSHDVTSACFRLVTDIDLAGITWKQAPVPFFDGALDGAGHVIAHLTIAAGHHCGLFGALGPHASVTDLGIVDANVESLGYVGILAGQNSGRIARCYAQGVVHGMQTFGGLLGLNWGLVEDSYAAGTVTGYTWAYVGGLAGYNYGALRRCYAAAAVSCPPERNRRGGLVAKDPDGNGVTEDSYFLLSPNQSGLDNGFGTALLESQMRERTSFPGWDFDSVWMICAGRDYPHLQWENIQCWP